jgi:hypothetical protein
METMRRKAIEWTIFGIIAAGLVIFVGWYVPRAADRFVPWLVARFKVATGKQHVPAGAKVNAALRRNPREEENRLARGVSAATHGRRECLPAWCFP